MKLPSFVRIDRGEAKEDVLTDDWSKYPLPYDILTEHERIHFVLYRDEPVEFMPLTMAEEYEQEFLTGRDPLSPLYYMLAKALIKRVRDGFFTIEALSDGTSVVDYVKDIVMQQLPPVAVHDIYASIQKSRQDRQTALDKLFANHSEEIKDESSHKPLPRKDSPMDIHVGISNMFSKNISPFTIGTMTRLQLGYINRIASQAGVRAMNDHDHASKQRK